MNPKLTEYKITKYLSWAVAVILILLPFHALITTWLGSNFGHYDLFKIWKEILLIGALPFVAWIVWRSTSLRKWLMASWTARLIGLYILLHIVLGAWAYVHNEVSKEALIYGLIINLRFLTFFLVCYVVASKQDFLKKNWRMLLLAPAALVILFGLAQRFILPYDFLTHFGYGPDTIAAYQTVDSNLDFRRIQSTLRGANPLGAYLVLIIAALFVAFKQPGITRTLSLLAAFITIFYTYSRSAWIGLVVALGLLSWWAKTQADRVKWVVLASFSLVVIISGLLILLRTHEDAQDTLLHTSSTSSSEITSNEARADAIKNGTRDILHKPQGGGPGTAGPASVRNNHPPRVAENYYLQIGQEVGVVGMVLFVAINILIGLDLWRRKTDLLAQALLASLVGLTLVSMLTHAWADDTLSYIWWGLAGVALAPAIIEVKHKKNGKKTNQA